MTHPDDRSRRFVPTLPFYPSCFLPLPIAPILFCKACESTQLAGSPRLFFVHTPLLQVFIAEITARAFIVADSNKRRTLSRADIAKALSKSDQFDFLIDIVPRDEPFVPGVSGPGKNSSKKTIPGSAGVKRESIRVVGTFCVSDGH